jgi:hypothetical protein
MNILLVDDDEVDVITHARRRPSRRFTDAGG